MNTIYSVGFSSDQPDNFFYDTTPAHFLLVMTLSPAVFRCNESLVRYPAGAAILYEPGANVYYKADGGPYSDDWLYISLDENTVSKLPCTNIPFLVSDPEYCHNLLQLLTWEFYGDKDNRETILSDLVYILFSRLYTGPIVLETTAFTYSLNSLRKAIQRNPWLNWTVKGMAERLSISPSYLQALYKQQFGVPCMSDVINNRIRRAKNLLEHTQKSAAEIAASCGYNTVEHFNRQFKKNVGMTPTEYRKQASQINSVTPAKN